MELQQQIEQTIYNALEFHSKDKEIPLSHTGLSISYQEPSKLRYFLLNGHDVVTPLQFKDAIKLNAVLSIMSGTIETRLKESVDHISNSREIEPQKLGVKIYPAMDQKIQVFVFNGGEGEKITVEEFLTVEQE